MQQTLNRLGMVIWDNLGSCTFCIGKAFQAAAAAWSLTLLFALLGWTELCLLTVLGAAALSMLWVAHLFVHATKLTALAERGVVTQTKAGVSRRAMLPLFVRTFCATAVLSATSAFAQQFPCTAGTGSCQQDNCPPCTRPCYPNGGCIKCTSCPPCYSGQQC